MGLENCTRCGRVFNRITRDVCPECVADEDRTYKRITAYLHEHPESSVAEVARATETEESRVLEFVRAGRLALKSGVACERCGEPITTGRLCDRCAREVSAAMRGEGRPEGTTGAKGTPDPSAHKNRMHTADFIRRRLNKDT